MGGRYMRYSILFGALACAAFEGACTTIPLARPDLVPAMVHHVQCELKDARKNLITENRWLDTWAAAFTLTMKAEQQGNAAPEISLLGPFHGGTFGIPIGVGISADATRT